MSGCLPISMVGVMQAAEDGHGADWSVTLGWWPLGRDGRGDRLSDALVAPVVVDVGDVLREHAARVALVEDEQMVEACATDAAEKPLLDCVPRVAL